MPEIDDPMLALIARFVGMDPASLGLSSETYLRRQFEEIRAHVAAFPEAEQQQAALDWISVHAEEFRRQWQHRELSQTLAEHRCEDCPLIASGAHGTCVIHARWASLLQEYLAGAVSSGRFVESTLQLLEEHKNKLKITAVSRHLHLDSQQRAVHC